MPAAQGKLVDLSSVKCGKDSHLDTGSKEGEVLLKAKGRQPWEGRRLFLARRCF